MARLHSAPQFHLLSETKFEKRMVGFYGGTVQMNARKLIHGDVISVSGAVLVPI